MLKALFKLDSALPPTGLNPLMAPDKPLMVDYLCNAASLMPFTQSEANIASSYMSACSFREGQILIEEGSRIELDRMLWILRAKLLLRRWQAGVPANPSR